MRNAREIPAVPSRHLLGHLPALRRDSIGWLRRIASVHPDLSRARLGVVELIVVSQPELVQEILVDQADAFEKTAGLKVFAAPVLGDGLLRLEGSTHRARRRMLAPMFMPRRVAGYAQVMVEQAEHAARRMAQLGEVDVADETMRVTLQIVAKTLFDAELASDTEQIAAAITEAMHCMMRALTGVVPLPPQVPSPTNRRMHAAVRRLDAVVYRIIAQRRSQTPRAGEGDLLSLLLRLRDAGDGSALTDKDVRDEVMTLLLAGHETTGTALAWTLELLSLHPDVREQVEREVDGVLASEALGAESLSRLSLTQQAIKEAMRLRPPAYEISRRATRDVSLGGHRLRKGTWLLINTVGMHHRPDLFPAPDVFMPERFSPERERALPRHAYLPFGAGPRVCIGSHFALMEATLILATFVHQLRFQPRYAGATPMAPLLTLRPATGMRMRVCPRGASSGRSETHADART
jgi:cytochrome P450